MILQNLSKAIRQQNWFAVFLEFVIVIAGVVIGFQVTEWASAWAEAERRAVAMDRLHEEIEGAVSILQGLVSLYDELNTDRTQVIEYLLADDIEALDNVDMVQATVSAGVLPAFSPRQGVYTEIVSSGMLSTLGDEAFRDALGDYQSGVIFLQGQIDYLRTLTATRDAVSDLDYVRLEYAPGTLRERRTIIDWEAAAGDAEFLQRLLDGNNSMRAMTTWWRNTLEQAEALCAETSRLTGRACEPPEGPFE